MKYGFNVHTGGPLATKNDMQAIVKHGEKLGFSLLSVPDHVVFPRSIDSQYPYGAGGKLQAATASADGNWFEPLALLAYLAAITTKVRLLSAVLVIPNRHPVLTAKLVATIDALSEGRVVLGCGAGWLEEEFIAVGAPPFAERGKITDEYIAAFKVLWTEDAPHFEGNFTTFSDIHFAPKPVQTPHPPIWIGGEGRRSLQRAAKFGDAWFPVGCNARFPLDTEARCKAGIGQLHKAAEAAGRSQNSIEIAYWAAWYGGCPPIPADPGMRQLFTGGSEETAADIAVLESMGVQHIVLNFVRNSLAETLDEMERFAREVVPLVS